MLCYRKYLLLLLAAAPMALLRSQPLPGGVNGASVWMQTAQRSGAAHGWVNKAAGSGGNLSVQGRSTALNNHPALVFDGNSDEYVLPIDTATYSAISLFAVYMTEDSASEQSLWSIEGEDNVSAIVTSHRLADLDLYRYSSYKKSLSVPSLYTYVRKKAVDSTASSYTLRMGHKPRSQELPISSFKGVIPEFIMFDRMLSLRERQQVESYLALKYGLTIDQSWPTSYLSSRGDVVWDASKNGAFSHRIAGVGRDDGSGLNQAVSSSSLSPNLLTIAVSSTISDNSFLVWGDDNSPLRFTKEPGQPKRLQRSWRINAFGGLAGAISTLTFDYLQLEDRIDQSNRFWLMVDESGTGKFPIGHTAYYPSSSTQPSAGCVQFSSVKWSSASSAFTLFEAADFFVRTELDKPICGSTNGGSITVEAMGGKAPYQLQLTEQAKRYPPRQQATDSSVCRFTNVLYGEYLLVVEDANGNRYEETLLVDHADGPQLQLSSSYTITSNEPLYIWAVDKSIASQYQYKWVGSDGKIASSSASIEIKEKGRYRVEVSNDSGCTSVAEFSVEFEQASPFSSIVLYPNPSTDGKFQLRVNLERPLPLAVLIYDLGGRLLTKETLPGKETFYRYEGYLAKQGYYIIVLKAEHEQVERKLIIGR